MRFNEELNHYFETNLGAFSKVTQTENKDSQITVTKEEKEIIESYFGTENILHRNSSSDPSMAMKEFLLYPKMGKVKLNLVYPKKGKTELRLYLSDSSGFKPNAGDVWFTYLNKENKIVIGGSPAHEWNRISKTNSISDTFPIDINEFISIANAQRTGNGITNEASTYTKKNKITYHGLSIEIGFGQGRATAIPWIAFLGYGQKVTKGIYPVLLYYKEIHRLILAYGVSEKEKPIKNWDNNQELKTIKTFLEQNIFPEPYKYGSSFFYQVYLTDNKIHNNVVKKDLDLLIEIYNQVFTQKDAVKTSKMFIINELYKTVIHVGLNLSEKLLTRFTSSLIAKPFLILTGLSGSGKTKLAQAFAQWICESKDQYRIIPVGADWTNREPLLGYTDGLREGLYVMPDSGALQVIINALKPENKNKPYFLILDEMNLSHVERYFADFLSIMESHKEIKLYDGSDRKNNGTTIPKEIPWPKNLFIVGTVNVDETTYMFSPKVLDRANVIEFRIEQDEMKQFLKNSSELRMEKLHSGDDEENPGLGAGMAADFLRMAGSKTPSRKAEKALIDFFPALQKAGTEFGYRSAYEINRLTGILEILLEGETILDGKPVSENDFIDIAIMQKLLPKLHGSRNKLVPVLVSLGKLCLDRDRKNYPETEDGERNFIKECFDAQPPSDYINYSISFDKIRRMYFNVIANGFTSYAEN